MLAYKRPRQPTEKDLEIMSKCLRYDATTGELYWKNKNACATKIGTKAYYTRPDGYRVVGINRKQWQAGRVCWFLFYGWFPTKQIDHINRNNSDDRIQNLRVVSSKQNAQNRGKYKKQSGLPAGVSFLKGAYSARIQVNGKPTYLGCFKTPEDASAAYEKERALLHPYYSGAAT